MIKKFMVVGALAAAVLLLGPPKVSAQGPFNVDYFGAGDQLYTIINYCNLDAPGFNHTGPCSEFDAAAYISENIYVYANQDIVACGCCTVSPNGSLEENLNTNLLGNPIRGVRPTAGVVKFVTTPFESNFCDPTALGAAADSQTIFRTRDGGENDTELARVPLSTFERDKLNRDCTAINIVLSGFFNVTCGTTDPPKAHGIHNALKKKMGG